MTLTALPLDGIRVIDFSRVLAGPLCSALLGDLGAEVIKVEPPDGDDYRVIGPFAAGESGLFGALGASGQGEGLPMSKPEGYGEQNGARYWQRPRIPG